jgi:DNA invertase Pin-like site-specific DNA recombinase
MPAVTPALQRPATEPPPDGGVVTLPHAGRLFEYLLGTPPRGWTDWVAGVARRQGKAVTSVFHDGLGSAGLPFTSRPAVSHLTATARPGDEVLVPRAASLAADPSKLAAAIRWLTQAGLTLQLAAPVVLTIAPAAAPMVLAGMELHGQSSRSARSRAAQAGIARARAAGRRHSRHPGYGFKWVGRKGHQRRIPDDFERAVIGRIVAWREGGHSWRAIAVHLLRHGVTTSAGAEWSVSRVRRAYSAAVPA